MSSSEIEKLIPSFLESEAKRIPGAAKEISMLKFSEFVSRDTNNGMVYFNGPDKYRLWKCDYINGQLQALTFDD